MQLRVQALRAVVLQLECTGVSLCPESCLERLMFDGCDLNVPCTISLFIMWQALTPINCQPLPT